MSSRSMRRVSLAVIAALALSHVAEAQVLYQETFDTDPTANWQFNSSGSGNAADFYFDYSTVGVPPAPGGSSTRGLKLTANVAAGVFGGGSASPIGLTLPSEYILTAYVWQNSIGPFPGGGSGSTQLTNVNVGVSGLANEFPGGTISGVQFAVTGEGGSGSDWRAYSALMPNGAGATLSTTNTPPVYPAGSLNNTATYYTAVFAGQTPPAAQTILYASQTGTTAAGTPGFLWNLWEITKTNSSISWKINGTEFATVGSALYPATFGGNNIAFGQSDINAGSSTDPNAGALIFGLVDSITVTAVPEPSALALAGVAIAGLAGLARRRLTAKLET
jgi:hypothetical protein